MLTEYAAIPYAHGDVKTQPVFDRDSDHYLLMVFGRDASRRVHGCLVHIDLVDGKIWIQRDGTEHGMARELIREGIPPERIVLAFHPSGARLYSEFQAA
ncbi:XisI protein [Sorangium sp. So ce429]